MRAQLHKLYKGAHEHTVLLLYIVLGVWFWGLTCSLRAQEYELHGSIVLENLDGAKSAKRTDFRNFSIFVKDCQWLVRTEAYRPNHTPNIREVSARNAHEIIDLKIPGVLIDVPSAAGSNVMVAVVLPDGRTNWTVKRYFTGKAHNQAVISSNTVPASCNDKELPTSHLWLMFASQCYFRDRTNKQIPPLYDINACVLHDKDLTLEADWKLSTAEPPLPIYVRYMNMHGWPRRDTNGNRIYMPVRPPYNKGFVAALYSITGTTNIGKYTLPTGFTFQQFLPGGGRSKDDLKVIWRGTAVVTNWSAGCSLMDVMPLFADNTVVIDHRLLHANAAGSNLLYSCSSIGHWPSVEEALRAHERRLRRFAKPRADSKLVYNDTPIRTAAPADETQKKPEPELTRHEKGNVSVLTVAFFSLVLFASLGMLAVKRWRQRT